MKEIKVRVWAYASKKYFYPNGGDLEFVNGVLFPLPNTELEQYTGLHDKNGKEIYEGDIVESSDWNEFFSNKDGILNPFIRKFEIVFYKSAFCLKENKSECFFTIDKSDLIAIGNIHENPELLKK